MTNTIANLETFLQPVGLTAILVIIFGWFSRAGVRLSITQLIMGAVFGVAAIAAMASPINIAEGVIYDMRNLFVGISAAFFGWRGGIVTVGITIATRIYIGGDGAESGVVAATLTSIMGLIWYQFISPRIPNIMISLPILAAQISLSLVSAFMLPAPIAIMFLRDLAPLAIVLNFAGTGLFALLIYREIAIIDEGKRLLEEITVDPLTRILNRRSIVEIYDNTLLDKPCERGIAMACIDIDHFKRVNDFNGHLAGDYVLATVAKRIATCLRKHDLFCRMSGDEFLIVMTEVSHIEASSIAERCRAAVSERPITFEGEIIATSISIGTAWASAPPAFNNFRNASDEALYSAKSMGRDCSAFITHKTHAAPASDAA